LRDLFIAIASKRDRVY